jgi:hypothetical protein
MQALLVVERERGRRGLGGGGLCRIGRGQEANWVGWVVGYLATGRPSVACSWEEVKVLSVGRSGLGTGQV